MTARRAQDSGGASAECCWPIWTYVINCFHVKECSRSVHRSRPIFWQVSTERSVYVCVEVGNKWWTDGGAKIANEEIRIISTRTARTAPYRTVPYRLPGRLLDPLVRVLAWQLCQSSSSRLLLSSFHITTRRPPQQSRPRKLECHQILGCKAAYVYANLPCHHQRSPGDASRTTTNARLHAPGSLINKFLLMGLNQVGLRSILSSEVEQI